MDTDEFIAATMRRTAASAVPPPHETLTSPPTRRWFSPLVVAAAAAVVALIVAVASMLGPRGSEVGPTSDPASSSSPPTVASCGVDYPAKPLPEWARAGFTPPGQAVPHVLGDRGDMAAIVWESQRPLVAPQGLRKNNKILWVARIGTADGPLQIRATLASTGQTVTRTVAAAPGPSIIDLPAAGCWSFDLRWGSHQDHLVLGYASR